MKVPEKKRSEKGKGGRILNKKTALAWVKQESKKLRGRTEVHFFLTKGADFMGTPT